MAEEVEVVEAVPSEEGDDHSNKIEKDSNDDQITMETTDDQEQPPKKLTYNSPPRNNNPINLPPPPPPRGKLLDPYWSKKRPDKFPGNGGQYYNNHKPYKNKPNYENKNSYNGPPPPPPKQAMDKYDKYGPPNGDLWPAPVGDMPKIISLDVKCEKNLMKVYIGEEGIYTVFISC